MAKAQKSKNDYDTIRIPLIGNHTNRSASAAKDQIFYNVVADKIKSPVAAEKSDSKIFLNKRGAFVANRTVVGGGGTGRGMYYWIRSAKTYTVIADKLYSDSTSIQTLSTSTGDCWFVEATGTTDYLILSDGTKMYTISTTDTVTEITDADKPAGPITPVSLDGYVFVVKSGTDEIWNSDVDDPTAWTATSFLSAEMYPDNLVALARQVNYVVAFGTYSTEFFYDNENTSGSPLRRNESVALKIGLAARASIAQSDKRIIFIGQDQVGEAAVWMFDNLTPSRVSTDFIDRILANEGANLTSARGQIIQHKGHTLYVINLNARSLVYDIDEKIWYDWSINSGGSHAVLPFNYACQGANNIVMFLHNTDGKIYKLDPSTYQDDAGAILVQITTGRVDFGTATQKRIFRCELIADVESTGTVTLDWSDDDYQTWGTSRSLDLTTRPYTKALGVHRRPAFRLQHSANASFRVEALEFDYSQGVH